MSLWILLPAGAAVLLSLWARLAVAAAESRFSKIPASAEVPAHQVARFVLQAGQAREVKVEARGRAGAGPHYHPGRRIVRLPQAVYDAAHLAAYGLAAHEAGHALQHQRHGPGWGARSLVAPLQAPGGLLAWLLVGAGAAARQGSVVSAGLLLFVALVALQLLALPTEIEASRKAAEAMQGSTVVRNDEEDRALKTMLVAAAVGQLGAVWDLFARLPAALRRRTGS